MNPGRVQQLVIRTPEGIDFSFTLASPVTRCLAWIVDLCAITVITQTLNTILGLMGAVSEDLAQALHYLVFFVVSIGYGIVLEWAWGGQTLGKRLLRLRVMDARGFRLRFHQIFLRNLLRAVDGIPLFYLVGGLACLFSRHAQRLGDLAAGTIVIRIPRFAAPDLAQLPEGKFNSLLAYPHLAARLRQHVSPAEAALALQALLRRESLDPEARLALYHDLAEHFRAKATFPQEATDGLSDEQWLRNTLGVVFRTQGQ